MAALPFRDRSEAGQALARQLSAYKNQSDVLVLALPRGGVPVAYEVARALEAPLDIFLVRKLGVPGHEELAMGAIASGGLRVMNDEIVAMHRLSEREIDPVVARETAEIARRERRYRGDHPPEPIQGSIAILIDDGLATGATMRAAVSAAPATAREDCRSRSGCRPQHLRRPPRGGRRSRLRVDPRAVPRCRSLVSGLHANDRR
jgi:putative phosphoribosyl transferase